MSAGGPGGGPSPAPEPGAGAVPGADAGGTAVGDGDARSRKFRQAAFVYLHVAILYEAAVWVLWQEGAISPARGPVWLWLLLGAGIAGTIFWALWSWQNAWVARIVWAVHAFRVVPLIRGAYFPEEGAALPPAFHLTALAVVVVNLWMLARAGWDL